jgi:hypothetical protein
VLFPLSPDLVAVGTFDGRAGTEVANESLVQTINLQVAMYCDRQVFAPHDRFAVTAANARGFVQGADLLKVLTGRNSD